MTTAPPAHRSLLPGCLRAWLKEERRRGCPSSRIRGALLISLLLLMPLLALQLKRRAEALGEQRQQSRDDTLAIMEAAIAVSQRAARDWGHWDDAYRFMRGENPTYPTNNLGTAALFDGGAVMVLLDRSGDVRLTFAHPHFRQPSYRGLSRCLKANLNRLPTNKSTVRLACLNDDGALYLGGATAISNNDASAPRAGTIAMFDPLVKHDYSARIRQRMVTLQKDLLFRSPGSDATIAIRPPIHGTAGQELGLHKVPVLDLLARSLLDDIPLLLGLVGVATGLRAFVMLERRRQTLGRRQVERRANTRIRRACHQLDQLMDRVLPDGERSSEPRAILGRLASPSAEGTDSNQLEKVSQRFEHFLNRASDLALFDSLTQLPNRRYFVEQLAATTDKSGNLLNHVAVLFIDIDKFKVINDTYGHGVGDSVLIGVCQRLCSRLRSTDFIARYGGDELAVILDLNHSADRSTSGLSREARHRAESLATCMKEPLQIDGLTIAVSLSIGITLVDPGVREVEALIQRSDLAMYQAKRCTGCRIIGPENIAESPQLSSYQLFSELMQAIHHSGMQMHFQPICTSDGEQLGFEALARWPHPQRGMIPPPTFLEIAEQHRQMHVLGRELIRLSLVGFSRLLEESPHLKLYLNLAPSQLLADDLADLLLSEIDAHGLQPNQLVLELTEHSILESHGSVHGLLKRLRESGMRLALDDFGTGYSSLALLRSLHPELVKIDKSFTEGLGSNDEAVHILTLIAELAPRLGLELVAEGIEDHRTLQQLAGLGVGLFQGYALGAPAPLEHWLGTDQEEASSRSIV